MEIIKINNQEELVKKINDYLGGKGSVLMYVKGTDMKMGELDDTPEDMRKIEYPFTGVFSCDWGKHDYLSIGIVRKIDAALLLTTEDGE